MKMKIVILGICALLTACGMGKRSTEATGDLSLSNLSPHSYLETTTTLLGDGYRVLGSFDNKNVLSQLKDMESGSEIGTLSVVFGEEKYKDVYENEIIAEKKYRTQAMQLPVILDKADESGKFKLVVRDEASRIKVTEEEVTVKAQPKKFCDQAMFYLAQLADQLAIPNQKSRCYMNGDCEIIVKNERFDSLSQMITYNMLTNPSHLSIGCEHEGTEYGVRVTKMNRSAPKVAIIKIDPMASRTITELKFNL